MQNLRSYLKGTKDFLLWVEKLKKQSGGSGLFADMEFELGPADEEFLEDVKMLCEQKLIELS